jgi:hypothetical protein
MAIKSAEDVRSVAQYFESRGVPFHAWAVVRGLNPVAEAEMAAAVLSNGARSLTFDLEPPEGKDYWQGTPADAVTLGREIRRLKPDAWLSVAPDPRPWQLKVVPIAEFASFCNEIAPQTYWNIFNSSANHRLLREFGHEVGPDGVTPELILDVTNRALQRYGRPVRPIGQGIASTEEWKRFVGHAYHLGMDAVSVWRFGKCTPEVWPLLKDMSPRQPLQASPKPFVTNTPALEVEPAKIKTQKAPLSSVYRVDAAAEKKLNWLSRVRKP